MLIYILQVLSGEKYHRVIIVLIGHKIKYVPSRKIFHYACRQNKTKKIVITTSYFFFIAISFFKVCVGFSL